MALGCERALGADSTRGLAITTDGCSAPLETVACIAAGHPLPDERSLRAADRLTAALEAWAGDVLFLISGGASSVLAKPAFPVTLADKIAVSRLLLLSGADIREVNAVRKHFSSVKGGGLLRHTHGHSATLVLSDVPGDDPAIVGSGPSVPDVTTFDDAIAALERQGLLARLPSAALAFLRAGQRGDVPETIKPGAPEAMRTRAVVIGSNRIALEGAADLARKEGWDVCVLPDPLQGDTRAAGRDFGRCVEAELGAARERGRRRCLLAGGETTVEVKGAGVGGRNLEFALAVAQRIAGLPVTMLSAGSDGIDGPTDAAGAFVDGTTIERGRAAGLDLEAALANNDTHPYFGRLGDLFRPGPTGTNVMDLKLVLLCP